MSTTGESYTIVSIDSDGQTIHVVSNHEPVERSWWWKTRLWIAYRISSLSYFVWPKDPEPDWEDDE